MILCHESVIIGKNVMLEPNVVIIDHDHDYNKTGKIEIGNNVWIDAGAIILRGAKIGDNAVIGTGIIKANFVVYESRDLKIKEFVRK